MLWGPAMPPRAAWRWALIGMGLFSRLLFADHSAFSAHDPGSALAVSVPNLARAKGATSVADPYCLNLYQSVCAGSSSVIQRRNQAERESVSQLFRQFINRSGVSREVLNQALQGAYHPAGLTPSLASVYAHYLRFLAETLGRQLPLSKVVPPIRAAVIQAIESQGYSAESKLIMRILANQITVRFIPDLNDLKSVSEFAARCGFGGLIANAEMVVQRNEILVCPGLMLEAIATSKALGQDSTIPSSFALAHALSHEFFHFFGPIGLDAEGNAFLSEQFFPEYHDRLVCAYQQLKTGKYARNPVSGKMEYLGLLHALELGPDFGANDALRFLLEKDHLSFQQRRQMTELTFLGLCGKSRAAFHPDGTPEQHLPSYLRLEVASLALSKTLGCPVAPTRCDSRGRSPGSLNELRQLNSPGPFPGGENKGEGY